MELQKYIQYVVLKCLIIPFTCYCLFIFALYTLWCILTGKSQKSPSSQKYDAEPTALVDPKYGTHGYLELKNRDGLKIHYVANGDRCKPLMLFLHGFPQIWYMWKDQLIEFGRDYYAVAIDMPGYGYSSAPTGKERYSAANISADVKEFILELGYSSCTLVGHDWGAGINYHIAIEHPEVVDKLINMNAPHKKAAQDSVSFSQLLRSSYVFFFQVPYIPEYLLSLNNNDSLSKILQGTKINIMSDEEVEVYKYAFHKSGWTGPMNYYRNLFDLSEFGTGNVTMPSILIWGTEDTALGVQMAAASEKYLVNGKVAYVDGASHFVTIDAPEIVHKRMREFLAES